MRRSSDQQKPNCRDGLPAPRRQIRTTSAVNLQLTAARAIADDAAVIRSHETDRMHSRRGQCSRSDNPAQPIEQSHADGLDASSVMHEPMLPQARDARAARPALFADIDVREAG